MHYQIPLFDLNYDDREQRAIEEVLLSKWISMGPRTEQFEKAFAEYLGIEHAVALSSCTAALHLALAVLNIGPGDEVIVPSLTFVATVNAVRYVGARPVFADIISDSDLSMDPEDVGRKLSPRTRAVIPMHYGGFSCPMGELLNLSQKHHFHVVEDASHAPGALFENRYLGTLGDMGCFSFFSNKNLSCGEGGMLVTHDAEIVRKVRLLRSHGMTTLSYDRSRGHAGSYDVVALGYNYRMDDLRAALGLVQLEKLEEDLTRREQVRRWYLEDLAGCSDVVIPYQNHHYKSSNYIFPILLAEGVKLSRDSVREELARRGIQTSVHYPPVHRFSIYQEYSCNLPRTKSVSSREISLPMYGALKRDDVHTICKALKDILKD